MLMNTCNIFLSAMGIFFVAEGKLCILNISFQHILMYNIYKNEKMELAANLSHIIYDTETLCKLITSA